MRGTKGEKWKPKVDREYVTKNWGILTQSDIACRFGVTRQRICQIGKELGLPTLAGVLSEPRRPKASNRPKRKSRTPTLLPTPQVKEVPKYVESDFIKPPTLAQLMGGR